MSLGLKKEIPIFSKQGFLSKNIKVNVKFYPLAIFPTFSNCFVKNYVPKVSGIPQIQDPQTENL